MILALALLLSGWGWATLALSRETPPALWHAVLGAVGATGGWLVLLALAGLRWEPWLAWLPFLSGLASAGLRVRTLRLQVEAKPAQALAVVLALALFSRLPAWGWDFRYQWGLKARVFASFGGFDAAFLASPEVDFAHPAYPPLWPALMAFASGFGVSPEGAAGVWTALFRLGLASACVHLAGVRAAWLAGLVGFFSPVLFRPFFSGYAEPLLAFLLAASVVLARGGERLPIGVAGAGWGLLGLAKGEGLLWLASLGLASWGRWGRAPRLGFLASLLPGMVWLLWVRTFLPTTSVPPIGWAHLASRMAQLPSALGEAGAEPLVALLAFALAVWAGWGRTPLPLASLVFALGLGLVYLAGPHPLPWWLANSLARVLAVPFPALLAPALGVRGKPPA